MASSEGEPDIDSDSSSRSALSTPEVQHSQHVLGKRKREDDGVGDDRGDEDIQDSIFVPDENDMVPVGSIFVEDEDDGTNESSLPFDDTNIGDYLEEADENFVPYDSTSEPFPACAIYDGDIPKVEADLLQIPEKAIHILKQYNGDIGQVASQRAAAQLLQNIPHTDKLRIALLGDAGAGKSSTLNSLTDIQDLAKSLSGGQSCTCVPTEYTGAFPRQKGNFAAKIFYFDIREIHAMLEEQLDDYDLYTFKKDEDWDQETHAAFARKMQNALRTFAVLFCDLPGFKDDKAARHTLEIAYLDGHTALLDRMMHSCEAKLQGKLETAPSGRSCFSDFHEASTCPKLRLLVDPLVTSNTNPDHPSLWPLVRLVSIGVRDCRILKNLTIIDLPGISDTNESRVNITKEYVKTCDYLFIIANISRIVDDGMVDHLLSKYGKPFKGQVSVICTFSDDGVDSRLVKHLSERGQDLSSYYYLTETFKSQKNKFSELKARVKAVRINKATTKPVLLDIREKQAKLKKMTVELAAIDASMFGALVEARNAYIAAELKQRMEFHLPEGMPLSIFCVSNSHYAAAKGLDRIRTMRLSPSITGIPSLRNFTLGLPASKMLRTLRDYANNRMLVFLQNITLWVNKTNVDRRNELMEIVKVPQQKLAQRMECRRQNFVNGLERVFSKPMRELQEDATRAALKVHAQKGLKHPSTVRAFINKNGLHSTKLCPKECWNEQFSKVPIQFVLDEWNTLESEQTLANDKLQDQFIEDLQAIPVMLHENPFGRHLPLERLEDSVQAHVGNLENAFRDSGEVCEHGLRNLHLDITQHSNRNFFSRHIQPVYDECQADSGEGVTRRSMEKLEAHLKKPLGASPFAVMERKATAAIIKDDEKQTAALEEAVLEIFEGAYESFDGAIDNKIDDPVERPIRELLKKALPALNERRSRACSKLEAIEAKYST